MKQLWIGLAALLVAAPALAQSTPTSPTPPTPPPPAGAPPPPPPPPPMRGPGMRGEGAFIRLRGPGGGAIAVRCAPRDTTAECMDVVVQLLDKVKSMRPEGRMERPAYREGGYGRRDWDREGEERYQDRD